MPVVVVLWVSRCPKGGKLSLSLSLSSSSQGMSGLSNPPLSLSPFLPVPDNSRRYPTHSAGARALVVSAHCTKATTDEAGRLCTLEPS